MNGIVPPTPSPTSGARGTLPMDGLGNSPTPTKSLGAFELPDTPTAKPKTTGISLNLEEGKAAPSSKTVKIPDIQWTQPETVVQASPTAINTGAKSVVTFVAKPGTEKATVTGVKDGDGAFVKRSDGSTIDCRIDKINAPELAHPKYTNKPAQPFAEESKKTLEDMILNKEVTLRVSREAGAFGSKYGRANCQIEIEGKDVSEAMIQKGMAWLYKRYANDPNLVALEKKAKKEGIGLWSGTNPINPEAYSHMKYW